MQTVLFQVCDICNVVARLHPLLIAVAIMASRVSVPAAGPAAPGLGCQAVSSAPKPANFPVGACFSVGRRSGATSLLPSRAVLPNLESGKFKLMSGPVTSWPERVAARDLRPTSDINQKVPCVGNVLRRVCRPCFMIFYHRRVHAGGVMVKATGCYA